MTFAPGGDLFIAEQGGRLKVNIAATGETHQLIKLDVDSAGERGLVGIALSPEFPAEPFIYLYYTVPPIPGLTTKSHNRISRFTFDNNTLIPESEHVILNLDNLGDNKNHNGGALEFGKDGKLYIAVGDAGSSANAQNLDRYFGKILRLNPDGSVPVDNPFSSSPQIRRYFWAYGLRNPFTLAKDPRSTMLIANDVGLKDFEEIDDITEGGNNYGWPLAEGFSADPAFTNPLYAYAHGIGDGVGCAITGGTFFSPDHTNYPSAFYNKYFFLDFCQRWINYVDLKSLPAQRHSFATLMSSQAVCLIAGPDGNLYYLSRSANVVYKISYDLPTAPYITEQPADVSLLEGESLNLFVRASGTAPLSYQWQRNGVDLPGATSEVLTIPSVTPSDSAAFVVRVSNSAGFVESVAAQVRVTTVYTPPTAEVITPVTGDLFVAGERVFFSGSGHDKQEGSLSSSAFHWFVNYRLPDTVITVTGFDAVVNGSFVPAVNERISPNGWYEIILVVSDSTLLTDSDTLEVHPRLSSIEIRTVPPGLAVTFDGVVTEGVRASVVGSAHRVGTISPQYHGTTEFVFRAWEPAIQDSVVLTTVAPQVISAFFDVVLGLPESQFPGLTVYPNPASSDTCVSLNETLMAGLSITVYSSLGGVVWSGEPEVRADGGKVCIPTTSWSAGVYLVRVTLGAGRIEQARLVVR